jgi:uncharacterized protein YhaN
MQITEIAIHGFGAFRDLSLRGLGPGITVFEGQNEAGKTTLMAFIRAVLFGFESRKGGQNRYEPIGGGRHGGALVLLAPDGQRYRVERIEGGAHGRATLTDAEGRRYDEEHLLRLLYRTTKVLYQHVFAFGIAELQRIETLQAEEVSSHIYTVGMGAGLTPLATVLAGLEAEQGQLFRPGGKKPTINGLLSRLEETQATIRELQAMPDEYYALRNRLAVADQAITELQTRLDEVKRRVDRLEALVRASADWEQLVLVRQELTERPTIETFPEGGIERLEQLDRALTSLETRLDETQRNLREGEDHRRSLHLDPRLLDQQDAIGALEELRGHYRGLLEGLPDLRARVTSRRKALDETLARLGPEWGDERLARFEASIPVRERIRGFRDRLLTAKQEALEAGNRQEEIEKARREKDSQLDRLQRNLEALSPPDSPSGSSLEEREKAVREWVHLHHQRDLVRQHQRYLQEQSTTLASQVRAQEAELRLIEGQAGLPNWLILSAGMVFALLSAVAFQRQEFSFGIALGLGGIVTAGLLLWWRDRLMEQNLARATDAQERYHELVQRTQGLREDRERTVREAEGFTQDMAGLSRLALGREETSFEAVEEHLRALEAERRMAERRKDLETRIQDEEEALVRLLEERESLTKSLETSEQTLTQAEEGWAEVLRTMGLPEELTPDGALEVLSNVERAQGQLREWQDAAQDLGRVEGEVQTIHLRINAVLQACGRSLVSIADSPGAVLALRHGLEETEAAHVELERVSALVGAKQADLDTLLAEKARYVEQRQALFGAGGAVDPEEFRTRAVLYKRQVELDRQRRQLETAIRVHAGSPEESQEMEEALSNQSRAELERLLREARTEEQPRLIEVLTSKLQEKGRLEQQLHDLEQNERLSATLLEQQSLVAQLEQQAQRWALRAIAQHLLQQARQIYERERQPAVLRRASEFFKQMTGGRYVRIIVPLGEMRLQIEPAEGPPRTTEQLSRGTAEQLYLAMRLAFVLEYAKHAGPLPLVVDDILVNFDPVRARAAILALQTVAATHQVLVFTCHPHVRRWFEEIVQDLSVRQLSERA